MNLLEKQMELIRRAHALDGPGLIDGMELALELIGTILKARSGLELETLNVERDLDALEARKAVGLATGLAVAVTRR